MYKIGEFSKLTGVPVKTIRYYEEMGLLCPDEVDRWTGYRYFGEKSLQRLSQIVYLKNLGFSLKEISNLDDKSIAAKINELNLRLVKIQDNIQTLKSFQQGGDMKNFVNDPKVIGKWQRVGVVKSEEDFNQGKINKKSAVLKYLHTIYFLPNGEEYWVVGWSKGKLFVNNKAYKYQVVGSNMFVFVTNDYTGEINDIVVYSQLDNKPYALKDITIKDNVGLPFVDDLAAHGVWDVCDFTDNKNKFRTAVTKQYFVKRMIIEANGMLSMVVGDNILNTSRSWTKNYILDKDEIFATASKYEIINKDCETYLIMEWKSGDYSFGGCVFGYYVFKKVKI